MQLEFLRRKFLNPVFNPASLPKEIYGLIFKSLPISDTKTVSLVCKHWHRQNAIFVNLFSDFYPNQKHIDIFAKMRRKNQSIEKLKKAYWIFDSFKLNACIIRPCLHLHSVEHKLRSKFYCDPETLKISRAKKWKSLKSTYLLNVVISYYCHHKDYLFSKIPFNLRCQVSVLNTSPLNKPKDSEVKNILAHVLDFELENFISHLVSLNLKKNLTNPQKTKGWKISFPCDEYGQIVDNSKSSFSLMTRVFEENCFFIEWEIVDYDYNVHYRNIINQIKFHQIIRWCVLSKTAEGFAKRLIYPIDDTSKNKLVKH